MKALVLVTAVVASILATATQASARQACTPGLKNPGLQAYCGPAKATLKVGGKTYLFKPGYCSVDGRNWILNVGTYTRLGKPKHRWFGITVYTRKAGKHGAAVSWQLPNGHTQSLWKATVTLARGLKKGTFTGTAGDGSKGTGSFRCK